MTNNYYTMFFTLFFIAMIDLRFGIRVYCKGKSTKFAVLKPSSWYLIKSSGIRQTFIKLKDYFFIIFSVYLIENYMLKKGVSIFDYDLTHITFILLSGIELWSIGEKFKKLRGYNIFELFQKVVFKKDISAAVEEIKKEK